MFRNFLSALIVCAVALAGCEDKRITNPATATVKLANNVEMPLLGFGTWQLTGAAGYEAILSAIQNGYRHIDTAFVYGNEAEVGRAMRDSGVPRAEFFITSKVPHYSKSYAQTMAHFESTLASLGTDYVDLYLIHWPVTIPLRQTGDLYAAENREVWRALQDIYKSGRARAIGVSNFSINDLRNIMDSAEIMPMVNQIKFHIGHAPDRLVRFCKRNGIVVVGYSTLGRGAVLDSVTVQQMAQKYGVTPAQLAIRYALQRGVVPLVKAEDPAHQIENRNVNFEISGEDMRILKELEIPSANW